MNASSAIDFYRNASVFLLVGALLCAPFELFAQNRDDQHKRVRDIVLQSRQWGAHGLGYGKQSLHDLARKLVPPDIPTLIDLLGEQKLKTGVQFALAAQCEAAIFPIKEAITTGKIHAADAIEVMGLMSSFQGCAAQAQIEARETRRDIVAAQAQERTKAQEQVRQKNENDARIQRNTLKIMQGTAQDLSRAEREEAYRRSLKQLGLSEGKPMTPEQQALARRMYQTMVLDASSASPDNNVAPAQ